MYAIRSYYEKYYPVNTKDQLDEQLGELTAKKFINYRDFAGKTLEEVIGKPLLDKAILLEANTLESGYLQNNNGSYQFIPFSNQLQVSPINRFLVYDFNDDGKKDILAAGNFLGVPPYHGRFVSNQGIIISNGEIFDGVDNVITSYSIHYTKLYEIIALFLLIV